MIQQETPNQGLFSLLDDAARNHPDSPFLICQDKTLTYQEVRNMVISLAKHWQSAGIGRGDRIAICCQNRSEIIVSIFAASLLGAIFVVANSLLRPHGLAKILRQTEPQAIVAQAETAHLFEEFRAAKSNLLIGEINDEHSWDCFENAVHDTSSDVTWPGIDVDPACLIFTSGSTADPRGVTLSHDNIIFVTAAIQARLGYKPSDVVGCFLPLAFDYGMYQIFLTARAGAALYIGDPKQVGPRLPSILKSAEISVLPGVPTVYGALISLFERRPFELPGLRAITNTGERLPLPFIEKMETMFPGLEVYPMYGLTECKRVSILTDIERRTHPDSVGRPLDGTEVYAVDADGLRLPPGETGELVVRGRHVAHGYWKAPEETAKRFKKRAPENPTELFTGDIGSVDENGYIHFGSRADDQLKHRGNRISPAEIEMEACALSGVVEACLIKKTSDNTLHLFVTTSDSKVSPSAIIESLTEKMETFKVPDAVHIEPYLPKSLNSKVDKKALANQLEQSHSNKRHESLAQTAC